MSNEFVHKCTKCDKTKAFDEDNVFCGRCGTPLVKLSKGKYLLKVSLFHLAHFYY